MAKLHKTFVGFTDAPMKSVIIPDLFFTDLLPQIDDFAELKLTLHCFWLLNEQSGDLRYLSGEDLRNDEVLLSSLEPEEDLRPVDIILEEAINGCVTRKTLQRLEIVTEPEANSDSEGSTEHIEDWYFLNTVKGRQALAMVQNGQLGELKSAIPDEARLRVQRPNIFVLYEQNIGIMTPLIADQLRDMEKAYPPEWIQDAIEIAVSSNKRHLRYIQAILRRWEIDGRDDGQREGNGRSASSGKGKYEIPDDLSDIIIG